MGAVCNAVGVDTTNVRVLEIKTDTEQAAASRLQSPQRMFKG